MVADLLSRTIRTLPDLLRASAETTPNQVIIHRASADHEQAISYRELYIAAQEVAAELGRNGLVAGQVLLIALEASADFLAGFWGAILAGLIPAPLAAEPERIRAIWQTLEQPALLASAAVGEALAAQSSPLQHEQQALAGPWPTATVQLFRSNVTAMATSPAVGDLAYLQFSSGSTGEPRGIELTHAGLLANLRQMGSACAINADDCVVSWMPYYHDMGLIAAHLLPLAAGIKQVKIDEFYFARRPASWLELTHRHRATLLTAAPFALDLVTRRVKQEQLAGLDLSCVRLLIVGAEPIVAERCRAFLSHVAATGFAAQALLPVYGLAEASVGVTLSPLGTGMQTHLIDRQILIHEERASFVTEQPNSNDQTRYLELVDVGVPIPDCHVRIVDAADQPLAAGHVGHIQVAGPQLMRGYYRSNDPAAAFCAGWLRTGDLGFLHNGRLVITGRAKEIVIVNGHKHHAPDLEALATSIKGLNPKRIAVCGVGGLGNRQERVIVFLALNAWQSALPAINQLIRAMRRTTGTTAIEIVPLRASQFPRTTSGKIRRTELRQRYEAGEFSSLIAAVQTALAEHNQPASSMAPASIEQTIITLCSQIIGIDPSQIGLHDSVFDLGATSLQLMDLLAALGDRFNVEPDVAALRQRPTPAGLAAWLQAQTSIMSNQNVAQEPIQRQPSTTPEPIAIIGMACRLPDAATPEEFWANLVAGVDSVGQLPRQRLDGLTSPAPQGQAWGSQLDAVSYFDASFFKLSPAEAAAMDPQQRILLELAYHALERAGYAAQRREQRRVGVFIGVGEASYQELLLPLVANSEQLHPSTATGNMRNLIAGRIAHCLDLNGPALAIDTACSSTLVALHMARTSLLVGDCDLAIVGGINLNLTETPFQLLERAGALSPSGRCRAFDDAADGIVVGEGAGILIIERLSKAQHYGDSVLALIRGSAINNDGRSLSPMAPNPLLQAEALRQAYAEAQIDPASVSYIEAHGTGTAIGDPTEARSLAQIFPPASNAAPRFIGSVKTNLGHLLNAAGIPALIKVILMLQQRQIPPSLHYTTPNHRLELEPAGMAINTTLQVWQGPQPLRAGVNSFGFGGTNAHIILEEPPPAPVAESSEATLQLIPISACNEQALCQLAAGLAERIQVDQSLCLADLYFSLAEREVFAQRAAIISADLAAVATSLENYAAGVAEPRLLVGPLVTKRRKVVLMFAGQGAQYPQQGALLYQREAVFKATFDAASAQLGLIKGRTLLEWCFAAEVKNAELADTEVTQPLLVAFEVALARLVLSWGLKPDAVVGHSVGELAAACIAGVLSFEAVLGLARARGQLMASLAEPGMMAAVFAPEALVAALVAQQIAPLSIAAYNTPNQVVISGTSSAVKRTLEQLERDGVHAIIVNQSMAYHSSLTQPAVQAIAEAARALEPANPAIPLLSTVSVEWMRGPAKLDADYWAAQVVEPVRFAPALERLIAEGFDSFIEIGPGSTLAAFARQMLANHEPDWSVEALLHRGEDDYATIRNAIGRLWVHGVDFNLPALANGIGHRVRLPNYPFARERHWLPTAQRLLLKEQALELRPAADQATHLHGQQISTVSLQATANGYRLQLKAADGQILLDLSDLRNAEASQPAFASALLQQLVWQPAPLPATAEQPIENWILVANPDHGLAKQLAATLNANNQTCVLVSSESLATQLATFNPQRYGLIVLADWAATSDRPSIAGVLDLLALSKLLLDQPKATQPAGLWVVTAGAYPIEQQEQLAPEQALIAGLAATLPDQHLGIPCVALDLALNAEAAAQLQALAHELQAQPSNGVLAWRGGQRLTRELTALPVITTSSKPAETPGRVIVIVGGAGGVGAQLARHLASNNQPRLILLGRSALDQKRKTLLAELEAVGASAHYRQVDICNFHEVEQLIAELAATETGIFGVIQAAGIADVASLHTKSAEQFAAVLEPKVKGTWLLARALERHQQKPAFFLNCSSIAAVVPGLGGGIPDYVAANAFLDAFAASERQVGRAMTALNWGAWDGIGLAATPMLVEHLRQRGLPPLKPSQALHAFEQVLYADQSQIVIVAPAETNPQPQATSQPQRQQSSVATLNSSELSQQIQALVAKALKLPAEQIAVDASFLALGLDSLQAVDLVKQLEQVTGTVLPLTLFFEFQTIRELSVHLSTLLNAERPATQIVDTVPQTIPQISNEPTFPLAPAQIAFYVGHQLYPESPAFTLIRQQIAGLLDPTVLQAAFSYLVARHPMLRAKFEPVDQAQTEPRQRLIDPNLLPPSLWFEQREAPTNRAAFEQRLAHYQFDLLNPPLFRVVLCSDGAKHWHLYLLLHHSIADGWSTSIVLDELWQVYTKLLQKQPIALPALTTSFEQYVIQTLQIAASPQANIDRAWWQTLLRQHSAALAWSLPNDAPAEQASAHPIGSVYRQLAATTSRQLRQHAASIDVSLFHLLLAIYARQLAAWSQTNAIAINVAEHGRGIRLTGIEQIVGCCADHLPLPLELTANQQITDLAIVIREQWTQIQQHATVAALDLARMAGVREQTGPRAPGAASFSLARFPASLPTDCPIAIEVLTASTATATTKLSLLISEVNGQLQTTWMYATAAFQTQTIEQLADSYQQELAALGQPTTIQQAFQPVEPESLPQIKPSLLTPARILAQCIRQPERIAVKADGATLTYAQLATSASHVARWLVAHGARPNQPVGLLTQPTIASVVGIVGALWAGVPWLGLNTSYPLRQLETQLNQVSVQLLLYHQQTAELAHQLQASAANQLTLLDLDQLLQAPLEPTLTPEIASPKPDDLAYVMFTSGSTGAPKGVPISQRSLANYLAWLVERFGYGPNDRLLQTAALSFDAAISQMLGPLTAGGSVIMLAPLVVRDPIGLLEALERERPTIWRSVPALWESVMTTIERRIAEGQAPPALAELRLIGIGGEALPASYVRRWIDMYGQHQQIVNHYGPTEATINATAYLVEQRPSAASTQIPIGKAISGAITRVLDQQGNLCPALTTGELYIGGIGLATGYLGRPDLTARQFVPDPLGSGARLYRTGDLVRELADGNLVFIGRADEQIKLRGYRIEPAEIEAALHEHPAIAKAAVCLTTDAEQPTLIAYVKTKASLPSEVELRRWLAKRLPPQMIPQRFVELATLPTTSSGKIDRGQLRQLPIPAPSSVEHGALPQTPSELLVAEIWQTVLKLPSVNRDADFFELGGDSLLLLQVLTRLEGRVPVLPRAATLYQHSTLASFAQALDAANSNQQPEQIHHLAQTEHGSFALTPAQIGFLLTETLDPATPTTWCARLAINGPLDRSLLQKALNMLVQRHPMLRTRMLVAQRPPRQQVEVYAEPIQISFNDLLPALAAGANATQLIEHYWHAEQAERFELEQLPLLRMRVLQLAPTRHIWLIAAHHIIGDGWSAWVFGQELLQLYDALVAGKTPKLPGLRSTFQDYVNLIQQSNNASAASYWRAIFRQAYQRPLLQARNPAQTNAPLLESHVLPATILGQLRHVAAAVGLTPYLVLLSVFIHQLRQLTGVDDLVIGTAHAGRDQALPDIERIFGCFATALPIRFSHQAAKSAQALLIPVAQAFRNAYQHALAPSEIARLIGPNNGNAAITATGAQFFFTFLDFDALGTLSSETLTLDWANSQTEIQPPLGATELLFAARAANGELRLSLQAAPSKLDAAMLQHVLAGMLADIQLLITQPSHSASSMIQFANRQHDVQTAPLDAALIGYLPPSSSIAALLGLKGPASTIREQLRKLLFADGQPRWVELLQTPIGTSAMLCLPWFAEELRPEHAADLESAIAASMLLAQARGARCVSLAGMLPALTGYGFGVLRTLESDQQARPALTTGHATTVVAVSQTLEAALKTSRRQLADSDLAMLGLGSIGQSVLQVILRSLPHPRSLVLCDTAANQQRLVDLAAQIRQTTGYTGSIEIVTAASDVPEAVYQAQIIVAATSTAGIIEVERLHAGTILVDDSFPPCLDPKRAIARMQTRGDVLIVGGGQLACGPSQRTIDLPLGDQTVRERILAEIVPDAAASCQLEALLWAADPTLPLTRGLVEVEAALSYRDAVIRAGFGPAPLHLQGFLPNPQLLAEHEMAQNNDQQ
ncbi:non-ribosomal peptide synthetase/type I polyketide synthase [Herpetosiphon giganteus]|uniref:non-ribosomal peptide synthetase/type I polyketide synthase n=1 Tax=Herpetosiphon giganteus TaxID=2029754 RepID=UPI00195627CC|nr:non-ribosomal peptide synthetase/type I polyketide synthase [Herpetosiphon giganteus]MBM7845681.1 amino acid adenylation domain-containing protein [Herpetosiphon giganteus]